MDNESRHFMKLLGAAALTCCGVALLAIGVAMAGTPMQRSFCLPPAASLCCSPTASLMAGLPPQVVMPTLHGISILTD